MIPTEVREQIKDKFPSAVVSISSLDDWGELSVDYNNERMTLTVADTPEGWARATKAVLMWLENI